MVRVSRLAAVALATDAVAACGKGDKGPDPKAAAAKYDVAPINAKVPEALKAKLEFVAIPVSDDHGKHEEPPFAIAAVPKGWKPDDIFPSQFNAPDGDDHPGFGDSIHLSLTCQGACEPKDWEAIADKDLFAPNVGNASLKVLKDDKFEGGRLAVISRHDDFSDRDEVQIYSAFWKKGAPRMLWCNVLLKGELSPAADAFEQACRSVQMLTWDP